MKPKGGIAFLLLLLFGCSGAYKVFVAKTGNKKVVIRSGNHQGTDFFIVESKIKRVTEYEITYGCEYTYGMTQGLVKDYKDSHWRAVTDTVPYPVFFDITLGKNIVIPLQFIPITPEEIELLKKGIEKSRPNGCYHRMDPEQIIGFVKKTTPSTPIISNLERFIGHQTAKLLDELGANVEKRYYIEEPPAQLIGIYLETKGSSTVLRVYFQKLKHVEKENLKRNWDWSLISSETISRIEVYQQGTFIRQYGKN